MIKKAKGTVVNGAPVAIWSSTVKGVKNIYKIRVVNKNNAVVLLNWGVGKGPSLDPEDYESFNEELLEYESKNLICCGDSLYVENGEKLFLGCNSANVTYKIEASDQNVKLY